ncbi:MAG: hypothetical protein EHM35_13605 [Planctomycetaceae bacterium]|nr:MAG: hypothetical protein EHM35_13605 [Planctomycetaceae bacterium]
MTVHGSCLSGVYFEIAYHYGGGYWFCQETIKRPNTTRPNWPDICTVRHHQLKASTPEDAIVETGRMMHVEFEPEIEAYMYYNASTYQLYPHLASDVFWTCATYEPGTDTIRHEPTNVCLIVFDDDDHNPLPHVIKGEVGARQYPHDGYNRRWTEQIQKALDSYNSNPEAHGKGRERKEWLAWLVGEYIKDVPGEKPVKVARIARSN